ncbi:pyridoxal-dependent decarboxylase [Prescottella defluvii]|nr:pyridoxal-dependent decarboxylase [Prescottella defluvii]
MQFRHDPADILARLEALRATDAPTSGGRLLSYVYDPGVAELSDLAGAAALRAQPLNGLDPTAFPSIGVMERDLVALGRDVLAGGDPDVVGSVTSGGTESCMLAVKSARDTWRSRTGAEHRPTLLIGATAHAAFHKAAQHLDVRLEVLPVDPVTGRLRPQDVADALSPTSRWWSRARRRTRTGHSIRSSTSRKSVRHKMSRCTSTGASAAGCCRGGPARRSAGGI